MKTICKYLFHLTILFSIFAFTPIKEKQDMIQRVTRHSGYIEIVLESGEKHTMSGYNIKLIGWSRESYAIRFDGAPQVRVYDPRGREIGAVPIGSSDWYDLQWDGAHLTYVYENTYFTIDIRGNLIGSPRSM